MALILTLYSYVFQKIFTSRKLYTLLCKILLIKLPSFLKFVNYHLTSLNYSLWQPYYLLTEKAHSLATIVL